MDFFYFVPGTETTSQKHVRSEQVSRQLMCYYNNNCPKSYSLHNKSLSRYVSCNSNKVLAWQRANM